MRVVLDANFLMIPGQLGVDVFSELRSIVPAGTLVTPECVVSELKMLASGRSKDARAAQLALELLRRKNVHVLPHHEKKADEALKEMATEEGTVIATQDRALQAALREKHVPLITLRGKKMLVLEGVI